MYVNMLSDFLKTEFGEKYYRLSLNGGMSCPNRDGTCGTKGCIFCGEEGAGEFTPEISLSFNEQINSAKKLVSKKSKCDKYIAYFQAYSNTYAPLDYLRNLYYQVINRDDIAVLSIATRPDCINNDIVDLLKELNEIKPVWIERGLQTSNERTAEFIRRGYKNDVYLKAAKMLSEAGIKLITHIILGLPSETKEDMIESAKFAGKVSDGIKFHMLYVSSNTDLAEYYKSGCFSILDRDEYIDILCECIRVIPPRVVIHRLTGDPDKSKLIAPLWSANKKKVLREIQNAFVDRNIVQGEFL